MRPEKFRELVAATGMTYRQIAALYGTTIAALSIIANGHADAPETLIRWLESKAGISSTDSTNTPLNLLNSAYLANQCQTNAYRQMDKSKRRVAILQVLNGRDMTAREVAEALGFRERNAAAPRLTELMDSGMVEIIGKKTDHVTGRKVSLYRRIS